MVSCFLDISEGELVVLGDAVQENPRGIKARIGNCPQENNLDPDLKVRQNLLVFARYFDIPAHVAAERGDELLHFIGLYHKKDSSVEELSGGMKRRLMIARSLINRPQLLILDEPTTGLDPQARHQIWDTVGKLKTEGTAILLTTHYMDEAAYLCDRLLIMDHGRILESGRPRDLVDRVIGREVIETTLWDSSLEEFLKSRHLVYEITTSRLLIYSRHGQALFGELTAQFGDRDFVLRMANVEDVFLKLTGRELRD